MCVSLFLTVCIMSSVPVPFSILECWSLELISMTPQMFSRRRNSKAPFPRPPRPQSHRRPKSTRYSMSTTCWLEIVHSISTPLPPPHTSILLPPPHSSLLTPPPSSSLLTPHISLLLTPHHRGSSRQRQLCSMSWLGLLCQSLSSPSLWMVLSPPSSQP